MARRAEAAAQAAPVFQTTVDRPVQWWWSSVM